jgi:glycosyltransferase involved in cell wall biosynthesis
VYPGRNLPGGVAELYNVADLQSAGISYFSLYGPLRNKANVLDTLLMYIRFLSSVGKYSLIHVNPSLIKKSFFRDGLLILISRLFHKKVLVYWHGWIDDIEYRIKNRFLYTWLFKSSFNKANASVVLGSVFETKLRTMGYENPIYRETNCADNRLLNEESTAAGRSLTAPIRLLFLSRIEETKGVYIAIDTLNLLNKISSDKYELLIAGNGSELVKVKEYVALNKVLNVAFLGHVTGVKKHEVLKMTDILLFPTYYDEGLPLVILESMTYGIPVITRPMGGIPDILKDERNGFLTESKDPEIFSELVLKLSNTPALYRTIANTNRKEAMEFTPDRFKQRLTAIYDSLSIQAL